MVRLYRNYVQIEELSRTTTMIELCCLAIFALWDISHPVGIMS
jgi:hypothetical protein